MDFTIGLALGAGIPVIPICRAEEAAQYFPGDVRHHDMLMWHTAEDLAEKLAPRIIAALGQISGKAEEGGQAAEDALPDTMMDSIQTLIERGRERGYVTHDEIEAILPSEQFPPEIIEDTRTMLQQLGIAIVDGDANSPE